MRLLKILSPILILSCLLSACSMFGGRYAGTVELSEDRLIFWPCHEEEAEDYQHKFCSWQCVETENFEKSCAKGKSYEIDMRNPENMGKIKDQGFILVHKSVLEII